MESRSKLIIVIIILVAVAVAVWAIWFRKPEAITPAGELGGELLEKAQNPLKEELAETNPFKVEANPFSEDLNPYNKAYKNPFE